MPQPSKPAPKAAVTPPAAPTAPETPQTAPEPAAESTSAPAESSVPQVAAMSEEDAAELAQLRAEKAARVAAQEAAAAAPPAQTAYDADGKPNLDIDPRKDKELFLTLTIPDQIRSHYQHARGTIQDYARIFKMTVEEVLEILDMADLADVDTIGDQIDASVINTAAGDKPWRATGDKAHVPFSTN